MASVESTASRVAAVARAVGEYCVLHPRAADTVQGIRAWLPSELRSSSSDELEAAVALLVEARVLTRRPLADGSVLYFSIVPGAAP